MARTTMTRTDEIAFVKNPAVSMDDKVDYLFKHYRTRVWKFTQNRVVDREDVEAQFMWGIWNGLTSEDKGIGDYVEYVLNTGKMKAWSYYRDTMAKHVYVVCPQCGKKHRLEKVERFCKYCGAELEILQKEQYGEESDIALSNEIHEEQGYETANYYCLALDIRDRLDLTEQEDSLYWLLVEGARDTMTNYSKEIGESWGCSKQRVGKVLKNLQEKIREEFILSEEQDLLGLLKR